MGYLSRMSTWTVSDGTVLHYTDQGTGQPLVMLHGWGFSGRFFDGSVDRLAEHARVITVDLRAHGDSEDPATVTGCRGWPRTSAICSWGWS